MSPDPTPDDAIAAWLTTPEQAARISPTLDLAELRRLAEAATPGPWYGADELSLLIENERATEDIPYLAAANPAVVLALLDAASERDALAAKVERVRAVHARYFDLDGRPGYDDTDPEPEDVWRFDRDFRSALDEEPQP